MAKWKPGGPGRPPASARKKVGRPRKNAAARALGKRGGSARTAKQNAARKRNARLAGRPAKVCLFCGKPAKGGHRTMRLDASCGKHGWMYRQRSDRMDAAATRAAIREEIAALERLLLTLTSFEAVPETPGPAAEPPFDPFAPGADTDVREYAEPEPAAEEPAAEEPRKEQVPF